ncbi:hypothetical protein COO09_09640 [Rhizorhabdus dicambivorans]|uniref:Uncharacterized protein n=1 Tax=Rhizorhabdus dicambivorans TaxID=1850238 RepID=A0A2A4FWU9_9SPHN|nr:hypothetical protein CMV14_06435 [Rhizorhabdus dicambivorans]PCE42655.1 hypothetical protein COO09_09640 [Rhizorhabdus dicambivorans]
MLPLLLGLVTATVPASAQKREAGPGFSLKKDGTLVHRKSGTRFPVQLAGFTRARATAFDKKGHDFAISYSQTIAGKPVVARIAMIHIEGLRPKEHVLSLKPVIGTYFRDLKLSGVRPQSEGPLSLKGMKPGSGYQARFSARLGRTPYEMSLTAVNFGYWDARMTAAYPRAVAPQAQARLVVLVDELMKTGPRR